MLWSRIGIMRSWRPHFKLQSCNLAHSSNRLLYLIFSDSYAQYYVGWLKWSCTFCPKRLRLTTIKNRRSNRRSLWPHFKLQSSKLTLLYLTFCDYDEQYIFLNKYWSRCFGILLYVGPPLVPRNLARFGNKLGTQHCHFSQSIHLFKESLLQNRLCHL